MALALAALSALFGCTDRPATQILLRIDSDMVEGTELQSVRVTAHFEGSPGQSIVPDTPYNLVDGGYGLPGELSIVPREPDESRRLFITVTGQTPTGVVEQRGRVRFEEGRKLVAFFFLAGRCRTETCLPNQTCGNDGRCRPIDAVTFLPFEARDGSTDRVAPPRTDASADANTANPFPSTGAEGAFPPPDAGMNVGDVRVVPLTPGVHHFTTIRIPPNVRVVLEGAGDALDLRATGEVVIDGTIDLAGSAGGYGGSGGGARGGCAACGTMTSPTDGARVGGSGGAGVEGGRGGSDTPGGSFGGGAGAFAGGGGGGGGYCGGGGGFGDVVAGGQGAAFRDAQSMETGGRGGTPELPYGSGACRVVDARLAIYSGGDGDPSAPGCATERAGGGGGGSIGLGAMNDLAVRVHFRGGSGGGGGGAARGIDRASSGGGGGGGGALRITSPVSITVSSSGSLLAHGGDGGRCYHPETAVALGGGGGGSGGVVYLASPMLAVQGRISVAGGAASGATAGTCCVGGGRGGLGRIRLSVNPATCQITREPGRVIPPLPAADCVLSPEGGVPGEVFVARWPE